MFENEALMIELDFCFYFLPLKTFKNGEWFIF